MENHTNTEPPPRKSLYLRIAPILYTHDEIIRNKLETGKFPFTRTGIIKIIAMMILVTSLVLFLIKLKDVKNVDDNASLSPHVYTASLGLTIGIQFILFCIFSSGITTRSPGIWVKLDIGSNIFLSLLLVVSYITALIFCDNTTMFALSGPFCITGSIVTLIGSLAIFLMYRFIEEEEIIYPRPQTEDNRKSYYI